MVGGLHPTLKAEWYLELLHATARAGSGALHQGIHRDRNAAPRRAGLQAMPIRETLEILREARARRDHRRRRGDFRSRRCASRSAAGRRPPRNGWTCTAPGIRWACAAPRRCSSATSRRSQHRVDHLRRLRELQDETGGFTGFIPFAFEPETRGPCCSTSSTRPRSRNCSNLAVCRIYLDNFDHITAYWVSLGLPLASARAELRRGRSARHDHGGEDLPHGRREDADVADDASRWKKRSAKRGASRCSATRGYRRIDETWRELGGANRPLAEAGAGVSGYPGPRVGSGSAA